MIYIYLSDTEISAIQTAKSVVGVEKLQNVSRKQIPEKIIEEGLIINEEKLQSEIESLFASSYPQEIKGKEISLVFSDQQVFTQRFVEDVALKDNELTEKIINNLSVELPYDIESLINFYQTVNKTEKGQEVLYTATTKATISHYAKFLSKLDLKPKFISSKSFALNEFLKPVIGENDLILYCDLDGSEVQYFLFDTFGPLLFKQKKLSEKSIGATIKGIVAKQKKDESKKLSKVLLGGYGSIEFPKDELQENIKVKVFKMGNVVEQVFKAHKIELDTGGIPEMLFVIF